MGPRFRRTMVPRAAMACLWAALPAIAAADTVHLVSGGQIKNCRVLEDGEEFLVLRTSSGRMDVPKKIVKRIVPKESVFDVYDARRAQVENDNVQGLYELALWCRKNSGLRPEMQSLYERVLELDAEHPGTRHALGFVRNDGAWRKMPPLSVVLRADTGAEIPEAVRRALAQFASTRSDLKVVTSADGASQQDGCELITKFKSGKTRAATFYGLEIQGPAVHVVIELTAAGGAIGGQDFHVKVKREVKASVPDAVNEAIGDGFSRASDEMHALFDEILLHRIRQRESTPSG